MVRWAKLLLYFAQCLVLVPLCKGLLQCACTTRECKKEQNFSCGSKSNCYVQFLPSDNPETPDIIRGCIDEQTPLLCENRRPKNYNGPWPVLHCCKTPMCNQDVIPTISTHMFPEGSNNNNDGTRSSTTETYGYVNYDTFDEATYDNGKKLIDKQPREKIKKNDFRVNTINPLYIAVPVAGGCILLAIVIFAIYLLRRPPPPYTLEEYHYHNNLKRPIYNAPHTIAEPSSGKKSLHNYPDCERSSTGSETKLLMKV